MTSSFLKYVLAIILLTAACVITYSNALRSDFFLDDTWMFDDARVEYVQAKIASIIHHKPFPENLASSNYDFSYRPLSQIIPLIGFLIFKTNIFALHVINLILFILCIITIFFLFKTICDNFLISLCAALLFTVHPINNLMVNYISAQAFSTQLLLMSLSTLMFLYYNRNSQNYFWLTLGLLTFYLSTLCHESALALPIFLTTLFITIFKNNLKTIVRTLWPLYGLTIILGILWLTHAPQHDHQSISWAAHTAGLAQLYAWYLSRLMFLHGYLMMYVIPVSTISLTIGFALIGGLIAALIIVRRFWIHRPSMLWALSWFAIGILITATGSRFQLHYGLTIEPHWLYFSSLGFFLIVAQGLNALKKHHRHLPLISICIITIACAVSTFSFNTIWEDHLKYTQYSVNKNPEFIKNHIVLGDMYFNSQQYQKAEESYLYAFNNNGADSLCLSQLGLMAKANNRLEESISYYEKSLSLDPQNPKTLNNIATVYISLHQWDKAEQYLRQALEHHPGMLPLRINLAIAYEKQNRLDDALALLKENLTISPDDPQTMSAIGRIALKKFQNP